MPRPTTWLHFSKLILILFAASFMLFPSNSFADIDDTGIDTNNGETLETNPKSREVSVTATVRDTVAPSVPILVSPENEAKLNSNLVIFVWKESTDEYGIGKYVLYLDGEVLHDDLTGFNKITSAYTFTLSSPLASLTKKQGISDGLHTWKIKVYDNSGNYAESATWSFTIDSSSPALLVTEIGEKIGLSVSGQDSSTIPSEPIEITTNPPDLVGTTEANATVKLTVSIPGYASPTILTTTASSAGAYSFTLPTLPVGAIITLQVTSTDSVGNTSVIDGLKIKIVRAVISIPPPFDEIIEEIPIITPAEIKETIKPYVPEQVVAVVDTISPLSNSLLGLAIPLARLFAAIWLTGISVWSISIRFLAAAAHSVGIIPSWAMKGWILPPIPLQEHALVFESTTRDPIPFALLSLIRFTDRGPLVVDQTMSNGEGTYDVVKLDRKGVYIVQPTHRDYYFSPSQAQRQFPNLTEVYKGKLLADPALVNADSIRLLSNKAQTLFEDSEQTGQTLGAQRPEDFLEQAHLNAKHLLMDYHIPMETRRKESQGDDEKVKKPHLLAVRTAQLPNGSLGTTTAIMGVIAFFSPTPWNIGVFIVYTTVFVKRLIVS